MNADKDGGSAFPHTMAVGHPDYAGGMSLRDYFAAQALAAGLYHVGDADDYAASCYRVADAMLAARAKTGAP